LLPRLAQLLCHHSAHQVEGAARCERDHDPHRPQREIIGGRRQRTPVQLTARQQHQNSQLRHRSLPAAAATEGFLLLRRLDAALVAAVK
jgi:hypothetical protein